ncbi:MAG: prepilin peptidase [Candidatus Viridilinea halotolerans]|uniref:Prepilin peptidase n=1 Tax=Candidatus Viridilinea halotolerans TaxID=2491704 RepID=A0A426U911_9CHLR|nr:MAG: prepilin peptidase [Candidatus Viridilinea halotolerans]
MFTIITFIAGLALGSLLNMLIVRLPRERALLGWPRCTRTGETLRWWQLLPVVGWLLQRGRASDGRSLHWMHPLVDLLSGLMLVRLYQLYGVGPILFYLTFVCAVLLLTGAIDWIHRYIYTFVILGATAITLLWGPLVGMDWRNVLLGALLGGFIFMLFYLLANFLFPATSVPFGMGDVYLAIFIGAVVGLFNLGAALFYGMAMAGAVSAGILIVRRTGRPTPTYIAYGSYLCLGVLLFIALGGMG